MTALRSTRTAQFAGMTIAGPRPVKPLFGAADTNRIATGHLPLSETVSGWRGVKTLWYAAPSYQGPVLIRGRRLDGSGSIAFGEQPVIGWLVGAPGASVNGASRRTWPGGTWVHEPGCYGIQIDLINASYSVIVYLAG